MLRLQKENWERYTLSKYIASADHFDKSLIVLPAISGSILLNYLPAPVEITSASFSLIFSMSTGIINKLLKTAESKIKKGIIELFF